MTARSRSQREFHGIGERLLKALDRRARAAGEKVDKKAFTAEMRERFEGRGGQKGVSYMSILAYLEGESIPSLEWLAEAADALGVRLEWLTLGAGEMTEVEEARAAGARGADPGMVVRSVPGGEGAFWKVVMEEIQSGPRLPDTHTLVPLWVKLTEHIDGNLDWPSGDPPSMSTLRLACRMLVAAANLAGVNLSRLPDQQFYRYLSLSAEACLGLLTVQDDVAEVVPVRSDNVDAPVWIEYGGHRIGPLRADVDEAEWRMQVRRAFRAAGLGRHPFRDRQDR